MINQKIPPLKRNFLINSKKYSIWNSPPKNIKNIQIHKKPTYGREASSMAKTDKRVKMFTVLIKKLILLFNCKTNFVSR